MATRAIPSSNALQGQNAQIPAQGFFGKVYETFEILFTDILPGNFYCVVPNAFSWAYRTLWTESIRPCEKFGTVGKVADLYVQSAITPKSDGRVPAVLILHGEHSHVLTEVHLGDIAEAQGRAVFSVNLPYDDVNPENHRSLLRQSIDRVERMIASKGGTLSDLILVGHSRGAIEAAYIACKEYHPKVKCVIALAGRFKVIEPSHRPCRETLKPTVHAVWEKLQPSQPLRGVSFCQIAAKWDWCIDPEASIPRLDCPHRTVDASHLGVIYHPDTLEQFKTWVAT